MKNKFTHFLSILVLSLMTMSFAFASDSGIAGEIGGTTSTEISKESTSTSSTSSSFSVADNSIFGPDSTGSGVNIQNITVDDLGSHLESKGSDVVKLLKIVGQYICFGAFIISCITMFFGIFGNKRLVASSVVGALISGVCYAAIVYGEVIVLAIASWAAS